MTISPKIKIASGAILASAGAYEIYTSVKSTDKKKKILHGLIGAGLLLGGLFVGRKGIIQVIGLNEQSKATNNANDPAKAIASDLNKESLEDKNKNAVRIKNKNISTSSNNNDDSFDRIKNSMSADGDLKPAKQVERNYIISGIVSEKPRESILATNNNSGGVKVVGRVDPKILEDGRKKRQAISDFIAMMELEHKKIIKQKGGWNKDSAKLLRNKIAIEKARLKLF